MNSGVGLGSYLQGSHPSGVYPSNVGRSNSLHERRFNPVTAERLRQQQRLDPIVNNHHKISRITIKNQNDVASDPHHLERIDERNMQTVGSRGKVSGPVVAINSRRSKPFSANQNTKMRVVQETPGSMNI